MGQNVIFQHHHDIITFYCVGETVKYFLANFARQEGNPLGTQHDMDDAHLSQWVANGNLW